MTVDEAIKRKLAWKATNYEPPLSKEIIADNLSIEALKRHKEREAQCRWGEYNPLPGETEK